jgi:carbon storage regulator CsrA
MLVLSRTEGETIVITGADGSEVTILICRTGTNVSVGIEAPASVKILRGELVEKRPKAA